ncbi:hypothetical protein [Anabaena sphaerica]|uniref:hypothetical protein n=1 Tax=Anabaena sphaerica TaxID=212446 RepID=UPI001F54FD63|nr:hypothetical protein [Anabaena sphaerica]
MKQNIKFYPSFFTNWTAENLEGGDEEYVSWAGEIKIQHKLTNSLEKLENIEYVTQMRCKIFHQI